MKILQVVPFFTPNRGGSVVVPYHISRDLCKRGHEVTLITTDFEFDEEYARSLVGIDIIPFRCMANLGLFLYTPTMKHWLNENIKHFDVIHMHNFRSYQNNIVHYYAKMYGVPYILQPHGSFPVLAEKRILKKIYDIVWGNILIKDAENAIAVSRVEAEQFYQFGLERTKVHVVPNGVNLSEYDNLPDKGKFREKYGISDDKMIILYLGRLHKIKGINLLIMAFADLVKTYINVRLVIAGPNDGFLSSLRAQINDLNINDMVIFTGPLYESAKLEAYVDADVYVLPSTYEIIGITILEACACGTPVIVTNRCGISDIIDDNVGLVVEYNKDQLRDAMVKILKDENLRKRFGDYGTNLVRNDFGWDRIVTKIENLYEATI